MADKNIQLPNGKVIAFPDSMSDDAISAAIKANFGGEVGEAKADQPEQGTTLRTKAQEIFGGIGATNDRSIKLGSEGHLVAGQLAKARAGVQVASSPFVLADAVLTTKAQPGDFESVRPFAGSAVDVLNALRGTPVAEVVAGVPRAIGEGLSWVGDKVLGVPAQVVSDVFDPSGKTGEEARGLAAEVSPFVLGEFAGRGASKAIKKIGEAIGEKGTRSRAGVGFDQALPTIPTELTRPADRARMEPYLGEKQRTNPISKQGRENSVVRQFSEEKLPEIKQRIYEEQNQVIGRNADTPIVGGSRAIADAVSSLQNIFTENIDIVKGKSILDEATKYRNLGNITLAQAVELQRSLNSGLHEFYKKSAESQVAAENFGKPIAEMEKAVSAVRDQIAQTLEAVEGTGEWYKNKSLDYGSAARLEVAGERNITRAERPVAPFFNKTQSMHNPYASRSNILGGMIERTPILGEYSSPDALLTRALNRYAKLGKSPEGVPPPNPPPVAGMLPAPAIPIGGGPIGGGITTPQQPYVHYGAVNPNAPKALPSTAIVTPAPADASGLGRTTVLPNEVNVGNKLLDNPKSRIAPEYLSSTNGYPTAQMADAVYTELTNNGVHPLVANGIKNTIGSGKELSTAQKNIIIQNAPKPNWAAEAQALGIKYQGTQKFSTSQYETFRDSQTGSDFSLKTGETLEQALARHRAEWEKKSK